MRVMAFDEHANTYDSWFFDNMAILESEVALVAHALQDTGRTLSVGCGSGLFEMLMKRDYGIVVAEGIEPSEGMADIARKRGMNVRIGTAEDTDFGEGEFDTVLFNGSPGYITDLDKAMCSAFKALKPGGHVVVVDVPKEGSYALLYNLAGQLGTWNHPLLQGVKPSHPYPIEFVVGANWRTTQEKVACLKRVGFTNFTYAQTLTRHPCFANTQKEEPVAGYDRGDYVAIRAQKPY